MSAPVLFATHVREPNLLPFTLIDHAINETIRLYFSSYADPFSMQFGCRNESFVQRLAHWNQIDSMDILEYNKIAWDREVERGNAWTVPVGPEEIAAARRGDWKLHLTEQKYAPRDWFPAALDEIEILCLASGGGQQAPILAAAGARVTLIDNSPKQLERDRSVAKREGLDIRIVEGDMRDLSVFADESFDVVFHPVSNLFIPNVRPVWREAFRVLRHGGALLAGFLNPALFIFGSESEQNDKLEVRFSLPYSDVASLSDAERAALLPNGEPLEFGHLLDDQIGGQVDAGFHIIGFFEDRHTEMRIANYMPTYIATRAVKP